MGVEHPSVPTVTLIGLRHPRMPHSVNFLVRVDIETLPL